MSPEGLDTQVEDLISALIIMDRLAIRGHHGLR